MARSVNCTGFSARRENRDLDRCVRQVCNAGNPSKDCNICIYVIRTGYSFIIIGLR